MNLPGNCHFLLGLEWLPSVRSKHTLLINSADGFTVCPSTDKQKYAVLAMSHSLPTSIMMILDQGKGVARA